MKIGGIGGPGFIQGNGRVNKASAYDKFDTRLGNDEISISEEAISFSKVYNAAKQDAQIDAADRQQRIETIKEQLKNGTYEVSSEQLADSILGELYF